MAGQDDASELIARHATDDVGSDREDTPPEGDPKPAPQPATTGRSAALVTAGIILSRLFGLARQRLIGHYFGLSGLADVIAVAFRIGNITQNLLGEGTLSASFIPVYAKARAAGRNTEAVRFALAALGFLLLAAGTASVVGVVLAPLLTHAIAWGSSGEHFDLTASAVRILFPMTGLLVLSAWGLGVLNAHRRFFLPYAAPVLWSVAQIAALVIFGEVLGQRGEPLMMALMWGALLGAALQLVVLLPAARALLGSLRPHLDRSDPNLREAAARLPGVLLGRGVIQLSGLIDTGLVSFLGAGDQAAMNAGQLIYLLPMSILGTGEAAAALPEMAGDTADEDVARRNESLKKRLGASLARVTVLTVPATLVLALLGGEVIRVLLQSGNFDRSATERVQNVVLAYAFALLGNASARVLTTTAYALGDTKTPARYAIYRVVVSTIGSVVLMQWLGVVGVVIGAVIAAWVETFALGHKLSRELGGLGLKQIKVTRVAALGVISIAPALVAKHLLPADFEQTFVGAALVLVLFGAAFAVAAPALGLFDLRSLLRRKR
ncbi:Putative peptidoglycan lipid II flippase MurJ [Minicystis rosea]|nr:Putative peptidoglycan lipid II flippase MurJ [Minicystis rosea]